MIDALKGFSNNKSIGNDYLTKEFYEATLSELKEPFINSISQTKSNKKYYFTKGSCCKDNWKDKRFIKNWRCIS